MGKLFFRTILSIYRTKHNYFGIKKIASIFSAQIKQSKKHKRV